MFNKQKIINYIEDKHLHDGGYFFGKVIPSSGVDTYYAVKTLHLLRFTPDTKSIVRFWHEEEREGNITDLTGLYLLTKTYQLLNIPIPDKKEYQDLLLASLQSSRLFERKTLSTVDTGAIGLYELTSNVIYAEILEGELRELAYLVELLLDYGIQFKKSKIIDFVHSLQNKDGGFGSMKGSQFSTTYFSLLILSLLSTLEVAEGAKTYLKQNIVHINYLEDLFWLEESSTILGAPYLLPQHVIDFCTDCARTDGGFSRSRNMGISTIEYTYFAVQILCILYQDYNLSVWQDS